MPASIAPATPTSAPVVDPDPFETLRRAHDDVFAVFSPKVADYAASRPDYPKALFETLCAQGLLRPGARVADLGAGTGLLTRDLLAHGATVVAVEPNGAMRAACDAQLRGLPGYSSVAGAAEATTLDDASVDLITAAQAFHWFEIPRARAECLRILRPTGQVALVWNDRLRDDPLHAALDAVFARYGGAQRDAMLAHEHRAQVPDFFASATRTFEFAHVHALDRDGLASLVFSRSYMPSPASAEGEAVRRDVDALFARFAQGPRVPVRYTSIVIAGRPVLPAVSAGSVR